MNLSLNKDGNPCREAALYLAEFFGKLTQEPTNILNFEEGELTRTTCGTIACHGGWGCLLPNVENFTTEGVLEDFELGAKGIAEVMGFSDLDLYLEWVTDNPEKWGSGYGAYMFDVYGHVAFKAETTRADLNRAMGHVDQVTDVTLQTISDWYRAMASRLEPSDNGWSM